MNMKVANDEIIYSDLEITDTSKNKISFSLLSILLKRNIYANDISIMTII